MADTRIYLHISDNCVRGLSASLTGGISLSHRIIEARQIYGGRHLRLGLQWETEGATIAKTRVASSAARLSTYAGLL